MCVKPASSNTLVQVARFCVFQIIVVKLQVSPFELICLNFSWDSDLLFIYKSFFFFLIQKANTVKLFIFKTLCLNN